MLKLSKKDEKIKIIEHRQINQKISITLITIENERLVIATSPNAVSIERLKTVM